MSGLRTKDATVELHRCMVSDASAMVWMAMATRSQMEATGCAKFASGGKSEWPVDDDGDWLAEDLMEGVYEVRVDLPAGYQHVDVAGAVVNEGVSRQVVELAGGRASDETDRSSTSRTGTRMPGLWSPIE